MRACAMLLLMAVSFTPAAAFAAEDEFGPRFYNMAHPGFGPDAVTEEKAVFSDDELAEILNAIEPSSAAPDQEKDKPRKDDTQKTIR